MLRFGWLLLCLLFTLESFACLRVEGTYSIDGEDLKIDQKVELGREYAIPIQSFILNFALHPDPKSSKSYVLSYRVQERSQRALDLVSSGEEEIDFGDKRQIYAKGIGKKPHSILDLKLLEI